MQTKEIVEATCPDCRGPLSEVKEGGLREYRCLVGHSYSAKSLLHAHSEAQEKALWAAVVALEESANLVSSVAEIFPPNIAADLLSQAEKKQRQAVQIREILKDLEAFKTE